VIQRESNMRPKQSVFILLLALAAGVPALAVPGPPSDELERNRLLLESWRSDSEHYARLRRDLKAFWELPGDERDRLRRLDHELNEVDARSHKRLWSVLEHYVGWLERLPEPERQQIATAERSERLKVIRSIRDKQYLENLPLKVREELKQLPPAERRAQLDRHRQEDRQLRVACAQLALARPEPLPRPTPPAANQPTRLKDFPPDVVYYVENVLWRQVKAEDAEQIKKAEGAPWPLLARTIAELSAKHPVKLPGPPTGPRRFQDLPPEVTRAMPFKDIPFMQRKHLNDLMGRWPEFAMEYTAIARKSGVNLPRQLGPCHPNEFDPRVAQFVDRTLIPKLTDEEKVELKAAEGRWPEYPKAVVELSKKHAVEVPLMRLPGPRELWDRAKTG
jgi:hypothetical protein